MEKKLLVTVSEDLSAFYGVQFTGYFFQNKADLKATLFYTAPKPPDAWEGDQTPEETRQGLRRAREIEERGTHALETAQKELERLGFSAGQIDVKHQKRRFSTVIDIIQEGEKGLYDAVVLGSRARSWFEEALEGSVSKGIVKERVAFPVWICRKPQPDKNDVLVCLDGSEAAYRMVDHAGFILASETEKKITLFVVRKRGSGGAEKSAPILARGRERLRQNGVSDAMIADKVVASGNIAKAISAEFRQGCYGVIATGRRGSGQTSAFMGSVSTRLFKDLNEATLWICY